jgi:hypothetical protein
MREWMRGRMTLRGGRLKEDGGWMRGGRLIGGEDVDER